MQQSQAGNAVARALPEPTCGLCGAAGRLLYPELEDRLFGAAGSWALLQCPDCRLAWLDPKPVAEDLAKLYGDYYTHDAPAPDSLFRRAVLRGIPAARYGYADRVQDPLERRWGQLLGALGPLREVAANGLMWLPARLRGELLDVGCGGGRFLKHMGSLGWSVSGSEADPQGAARARAELGPDRIYGDLLHDDRVPRDFFDAVTLAHVVEHLFDPLATLEACRALLKPGGQLVLATPNMASLGHARFGQHWLHLDPPRHLQLFEAANLRELVERAGFEVLELRTPASSAHFLWQASSLIARQGSLPRIDLSDASLASKLRSIVFWAEEYARTRSGHPCGEELLLIARRPDTSGRQP
ncbi:MAG: class I SAM-dependent methyltransferase [Deltaproteobacteria bacterium]|nr:class I SAM-dependent methyltransferase [Deltaproteobacteria bacterium]